MNRQAVELDARQQSLLSRLLKGPIGVRVLEEAEREAQDTRRVQATALAQARKDLAAGLPPLLKASDRAARAVIDAREALRQAEAAHVEAERGRMEHQTAHSVRIDRLQAELRASAPEAIGTFLRELAMLEEALRASCAVLVPWAPVGAPRRDIGNLADIETALRACAELRAKAEALQLEALDDAELARRLEALRAAKPSIPELTMELQPIGQSVKVTGAHVIPRALVVPGAQTPEAAVGGRA